MRPTPVNARIVDNKLVSGQLRQTWDIISCREQGEKTRPARQSCVRCRIKIITHNPKSVAFSRPSRLRRDHVIQGKDAAGSSRGSRPVKGLRRANGLPVGRQLEGRTRRIDRLPGPVPASAFNPGLWYTIGQDCTNLLKCTAHGSQLGGVRRRRSLAAQHVGSVKCPSLGRCSAEVNLVCLEASDRGIQDYSVHTSTYVHCDWQVKDTSATRSSQPLHYSAGSMQQDSDCSWMISGAAQQRDTPVSPRIPPPSNPPATLPRSAAEYAKGAFESRSRSLPVAMPGLD